MVLTLTSYKPATEIDDIPPGGIPHPGSKSLINFSCRILTRYGEVLIAPGQLKDLLSYSDSLSVEGGSGTWCLKMRGSLCNEQLLKSMHAGLVIEIYAARNTDPLKNALADPSLVKRIDSSPALPTIAPSTPGTTTPTIPTTSTAGLQNATPKSKQDNVNLIINEARRQGITDQNQIAYILATAEHESTLAPIREYASGADYEGRSDLGNTRPGDGVRYKGRGFVQLTGRANYEKYSKLTGRDLVGNPDLALDPNVASFVLVDGMKNGVFTGRKLGDYIGGGKSNFYNARSIINGDQARNGSSIAAKARAWQAKLPSLGAGTAIAPSAPAATPQPIAQPAEVLGGMVKGIEDPYGLDQSPHLLLRGVLTDFGRTVEGNQTVFVLSGESFGKVYKDSYLLTDLKSPDSLSQALDIRNLTQQPLGVGLIFYEILKNWIENFWGSATGWECRARELPYPPNYLAKICNEGSAWSALQSLAIAGYYHMFCDHTGAICWERLPWSSRSETLLPGRCWEDLQLIPLPSSKLISWGDRLGQTGISNFIRVTPTVGAIDTGAAGLTALCYNLGSLRQYSGPYKREINCPIGSSGDQYYTSDTMRAQQGTNTAFVDLIALESIRWYDRPVQRVSVTARGESCWRIHTRVEITEDWACRDAKPVQYYVTCRNHSIDFTRGSWTTTLDLVRDRRTRYLGIGIGSVKVITPEIAGLQNVNVANVLKRLEKPQPKATTAISLIDAAQELKSYLQQGTSQIPTSTASAGSISKIDPTDPQIKRIIASLDPKKQPSTQLGRLLAAAEQVKDLKGQEALKEVELPPEILVPLVPDTYYFYDRFSGKIIPIGNDPIAYAKKQVIPNLGKASAVVTLTPQPANVGAPAYGSPAAAAGPAAPFTPVDQIFVQYLFHNHAPFEAWDFTLLRGGRDSTPIPAAVSGVCTQAGPDYSGYGNSVTIEGSNGICWFMAHMSSVAVSKGQKVQRGQTIGIQGTTGKSTAPHVHTEISNNSNPRALLPHSATQGWLKEYFYFISGNKQPKYVGGAGL